MKVPVDALTPSPIFTDQSQSMTNPEFSTITHKSAVARDPDCVQNCIYARILHNDCTHYEKVGNRRDDACLCRNINDFICGSPYSNCFTVCSNTQSMKEITGIILDICKAVGVHIDLPCISYQQAGLHVRGVRSEPRVSTTRSTTLPWGFAPWSLTTNGVYSIGYPNTKPSRTFYSTSTLYPGDHGYTTTLTDPIFPYVTQVIGISVPVKTSGSISATIRLSQAPITSSVSSTSYSGSSPSLSSTGATLTTSAMSSTLTTSILASTSPLIPVPSNATSSTHGLVKGAIIGIAIAIPIVVIGSFLACRVWFIRRRERTKNNSGLPIRCNATQMDEKRSDTKTTASSVALDKGNTNSTGSSIKELGGAVVGNPRFELDSTAIQAQQQMHTMRAPSQYTYIPYRCPNDDDVLSTRCSETQLSQTNNNIIERGHFET